MPVAAVSVWISGSDPPSRPREKLQSVAVSTEEPAERGDERATAAPPYAFPIADVVAAVLTLFETEPALADRLRGLFPARDQAATAPAPIAVNMSVREYAVHAGVSERTIGNDLRLMTLGVHFRRDGATGRRVVIHVPEADAWRRTRERVRS